MIQILQELKKKELGEYEMILFDNGSLQPESIKAFRKFTKKINSQTGLSVSCSGLLHSYKIPKEAIDNEPALKLEDLIRQKISQGSKHFLLIPFFIGPSLAFTDYLPKVLNKIKEQHSDTSFKIAPPLAGTEEEPDRRLSESFCENIRSLLIKNNIPNHSKIAIALVDHGSPAPQVTNVRNKVCHQIAETLSHSINYKHWQTEAFSMERREGIEYDFNEPLLEKIGTKYKFTPDALIIAMLFLLPGRHASEDGDVHQIVQKTNFIKADSIYYTDLLHKNQRTSNIIVDRITRCLQSAWLIV
jgi:sirohydrochlorin ferrochelatase